MNTKFEYLYRDAGNWKTWNTAILKGNLSWDQKHGICSMLEDGEFFIPEQVGLEIFRNWDLTEDDHCYCELDISGITETYDKPTVNLTARQLYENFMATGGKWNTSIVEWW